MKIFKLIILSIFTILTLGYFGMSYMYIQNVKTDNKNVTQVKSTTGIIYDISDKNSTQISNEILSVLNIKSIEGQTIEDFVNTIDMPLITQGYGINNNDDMSNNMLLLSENQLNTDRYTKIYVSIQQTNMDDSISGGHVTGMSLFIKDYNKSTEIFERLSSYIEDSSDFYTSETDGTTWTCEGFIYDKDNANNIDLVNQGEDFKGAGSLTGNNTKLTLSKSSNGFEIIIEVTDDYYDWPPSSNYEGVLP